jgi:tripartite-type tricarboxylate transporter receptor subunit TctC
MPREDAMRRIVCAALGCAALLVAGEARAEWPNDRPVRILVGFGPGGGTDIVSRILAQGLSEVLHQSFVVENKVGAGGTMAAEQIARAEKDGYTALMTSPAHTVSAVMLKSIRYDSLKDFAPVSWVADSCFVIIGRKDLPANNINELVALAKASPGKLNYGDVGVGSTQNFTGEMLRQMTGMDTKHIPYRSTGAVVTALLAGEIDYAVELAHAVQGQIKAGQVKALAVGAPYRWPTLPDVPTVAESGVPGFGVVGWYGWFYPAGTPQAIVNKTNAAIKEVLNKPETKEQLAKAGAVVHTTSPTEFGKYVADEIGKWEQVREKAGIEQR